LIAVVAPNPIVLLLDALFMAFASTQIGLLSHDVGHRQAFRGRRGNRVARLIFGNLLIGVSHSWWSKKHNQHHATPNHVDRDPDIQVPLIVFSEDQIASRPRFLRPMYAVQAFVFAFLFPLQAISMRVNSIGHLISGKAPRRTAEAVLFGAHLAAYGTLLFLIGSWPMALAFFAVHQAAFGVYNSSVFASNHKGMALIRDGDTLDFMQEQVLTSRNVHGHFITDFLYGGLNYQIEHHLFPTMPRNNLARAQMIVRAFCEERSVPYYSTSLAQAYREGFRHLHNASASLRS
jgi:fatty acid desaturase